MSISDKGEIDKAIADYDKAIALEPKDAKAYYSRGNTYHNEGEFDLAITDYNRAIELNLETADVYNNRGAIYNSKGEFDLAITDYNKAIKLNPEFVIAYYNRGAVYANKQEFDKAIGEIRKAIELKEDYAIAYFQRGIFHLHLQNWQEGKTDLITARDKGLDIADEFYKDFKSIEAFERIIGVPLPVDIALLLTHQILEPDNAETYITRGTAYLKNSEYDLAIADFSEGSRAGSEDVIAYTNRGEVNLLLQRQVLPRSR